MAIGDINGNILTIVANGLGEVPEVGTLLSTLTWILWPDSGENVWDEIKDQVEKLIDQKLADYVEKDVQADLDGIKAVIDQYQKSIAAGANPAQDASWIIDRCYNDEPHFKLQGYELLLTPLYAQLVNLWVSILRDAVLFGESWGLEPAKVAVYQEDLTELISDARTWVTQQVQAGFDALKAKDDSHHTAKFRVENNYTRQMTLAALDYADTWPYFDPQQYPTKTIPVLTREIYSDPLGTADNSKFQLPLPATEVLTRIDIWADTHINAVQPYIDGTAEKKMGASGGTIYPSLGGTFDLVGYGPVSAVKVRSGNVVEGIQLVLESGSSGNMCGNTKDGDLTKWRYSGHVLSTIHIMGKSSYYGCADCMVLGFRYKDSFALRDDQWIYFGGPSGAPDFDPEAWGPSVPIAGTSWVAGYKVRYCVTYVSDKLGETRPGPWWSPDGADSKGYYSGSHGQPTLTKVPIDPRSKATSRNIYRQFSGEKQFTLVGTIANNVDTTFKDDGTLAEVREAPSVKSSGFELAAG